jgi:chromosome segregation ATPase
MAPPVNLQSKPFFQFGSGIQALESRIKILETDIKERDIKSSQLEREIGEKEELISQLREQLENKESAFELQELAVAQLTGQVEDRDEELKTQ